MADISPFLSTPQQWIEELVRLKVDRAKIESREEHLRDKLRAHFEASGINRLSASDHEARLEARHATDMTQASLEKAMGQKRWLTLKAKLPVKTSEVLVVRKIKAEEANPDMPEIKRFFGGGEK
jgi:hypothetical protein